MKFPKNFIWVVLMLVIALIAYAVGKQGQTVKEVTVGGESGISIEFDKLKTISKDELETRQDDLESKLSNIEDEFQTKSPDNSNTRQEFNLSGNWQSNLGSSYVINQFGNNITIQEVHPFYGVTAIGQGVISQDLINISYVNAFYVQGEGTLQVNDSRRMEGKFTLATGYTTSTVLYR